MMSIPSLRYGEAAELSFDRLVQGANRYWTVAAGSLDWSCRKTIGHLTDCVFGYAMQLAVIGESDWLPFEDLHLVDDAATIDLLRAFRAIGRMFTGVLDDASPDATASDGLIDLGPSDWSARGAFEILPPCASRHANTRRRGPRTGTPILRPLARVDAPGEVR